MSTPHPDVEELADLAEGLLGPARTTQVQGHVAGCAECAGTMAAVGRVPALLADLPAPRLPAAVAARIEAALAEQVRLRAGQSATSMPPAAATGATPPEHATVSEPVRQAAVLDLSSARGRNEAAPARWRRFALAAASVAVVVGGTALVAPRLGGSEKAAEFAAQEQADALSATGAGAADRPAEGSADEGAGSSRAPGQVTDRRRDLDGPKTVRQAELDAALRLLKRDTAPYDAAQAEAARRAPVAASAVTSLQAGMPSS